MEVGVPDGWGPVGVDKEQMDHVLAVMESSMGKAGCDMVVLRRRNAHLSGHSVDAAGASTLMFLMSLRHLPSSSVRLNGCQSSAKHNLSALQLPSAGRMRPQTWLCGGAAA